tara:strand:- start:2948 stop:3709 length:762 start_codon:yes stop_codon:yes gene_type:complete
MTAMQDMLNDPVANFALSIADDLLMLGHVQGDWTGIGPILEEDIASSSMSQDDLSHALMLFEHLGNRFGLDADVIAYERSPEDYRCCDLVTVPDEFDWAVALTRRWFVAHWAAPALERLGTSDDDELNERCRRLRSEQGLHLSYLDDWMRRLGAGEGHDRMQAAMTSLAPQACMLFELPTGLDDEDHRSRRDEIFEAWSRATTAVLTDAGFSVDLTMPSEEHIGGRRGAHAKHFVEQHTEMNEVRCEDPGASW